MGEISGLVVEVEGLRFPNIRESLLGGAYNEDYNIWVSILAFPYLGKLPKAPTQAS